MVDIMHQETLYRRSTIGIKRHLSCTVLTRFNDHYCIWKVSPTWSLVEFGTAMRHRVLTIYRSAKRSGMPFERHRTHGSTVDPGWNRCSYLRKTTCWNERRRSSLGLTGTLANARGVYIIVPTYVGTLYNKRSARKWLTLDATSHGVTLAMA